MPSLAVTGQAEGSGTYATASEGSGADDAALEEL